MRKLEKSGKFSKNIKLCEKFYRGYKPSECSSLKTGQSIDFRKFMGKNIFYHLNLYNLKPSLKSARRPLTIFNSSIQSYILHIKGLQ